MEVILSAPQFDAHIQVLSGLGCFKKHPTQHNKTRQTNPDFTPQNQLNATFPLSLGGLEGSAPEFAIFRPSGKLDRNHRNIQYT